MTKIKILLFSCFAFMMAANLNAQCTVANGGPYTNLNTVMPGGIAPCDPNCGTVYTVTAFEVWSSESYIFYGLIQGNSYTVDICTGAGANAWAQELVVGPFDGTGSVTSVDGTITNNCSLTFTASTSGDYLIMINVVGTCGGPENSINGGNLSVQCNGVAPCTPASCGNAVCDTGEDYCSCLADCTTCVGATPSFITGAQTGGTLALSPNPVTYCGSEINTGGVNPSPELVYIPFVANGQQSCVTDWNISVDFGTLFNSTDPISAYTAPTPNFTLAYVGLTDADITASGGTVTATFVDATTTGACSFTLAINLATAVDAAGAAWSGTATAQCPGICTPADATFVSYDCATSTVVIDVTNLGSPTAGSSYMIDVQDGAGNVIVPGVPLAFGNMSFVLPNNNQVYDLVISDGTTAGCNIGFFNSPNLYGACRTLMAGCSDIILEGDLETSASWTQSATDAAGIVTPFAPIGTTGVIAGVNGAWLGGYGAGFDFDTDPVTPNAGPYTTSISQSVTIPVGTAMIYFWGQWGVCDSPSDVFTMDVDGTPIVTLNGGDVNCGGNWREYSGSVSAFADGAAHTVTFSLVEQGLDPGADGSSNSNFFVDEITLESCPTTTCPDDYAGGGMGNSQPALTGAVSVSGTTDYETPGVISSTQTVDVDTDYDSGDCIDMQPNFEVALGVQFDAFIDGANCNGMGGNQFNDGSGTSARGITANRSGNSFELIASDKTNTEISRADKLEIKDNSKISIELVSKR